MISQDLVKQLKGAGFPARECCEQCSLKADAPDGNETVCTDVNCRFCHIESPTLSELIEACVKPKGESDGRYDFHLERHFEDKKGTLVLYWTACLERGMGIDAGPTPEEAVANLWLALNKK